MSDIYLIDFDKLWKTYLNDWVRKNKDRYPTAEEMEAHVWDAYDTWRQTPSERLDGAAPSTYFYRFNDPAAIIRLMLRYMISSYGVPDLLLDRLVDLGMPAQGPLLAIITNPENLPPNINIAEAQITAVNLLKELDSNAPLAAYISIIANQSESDGLVDCVVEALIGMGDQVVEPIIAELEQTNEDEVINNFVDVLSNFPGDDRIFHWLCRALDSEQNIALHASYLGKYGDKRAIPLLKEYLSSPDINYLEFLEIRNALEELGEIVTINRDFSGDDQYEMLKGIE